MSMEDVYLLNSLEHALKLSNRMDTLQHVVKLRLSQRHAAKQQEGGVSGTCFDIVQSYVNSSTCNR